VVSDGGEKTEMILGYNVKRNGKKVGRRGREK